jgi:hypothetical protein
MGASPSARGSTPAPHFLYLVNLESAVIEPNFEEGGVGNVPTRGHCPLTPTHLSDLI